MSLFWPAQGAVAAPLSDEYAEVAGDLPVEGELVVVRKIQYVADPRYTTNGFLVISYNDNSDIRFRMKKSTAKTLHAIMNSMLSAGALRAMPPAELKRRFKIGARDEDES